MEARIGFAAQNRTVMLLRGNRQHDHSDQSEKRHGHEKMKGFTLASEPKTRRLALPLTTGVTVSAQASRGDRIGRRHLRMLGAGLWPTPQTPCEVQMVWAARAHTHRQTDKDIVKSAAREPAWGRMAVSRTSSRSAGMRMGSGPSLALAVETSPPPPSACSSSSERRASSSASSSWVLLKLP